MKMKIGFPVVAECGKRRAEVGFRTGIVGLEFDRRCEFSHRDWKIPRSSLRDSQIIMSVKIIRPSRRGRAQMCNGLDRKSTRLNSSHSQISYAVFCLKKKR